MGSFLPGRGSPVGPSKGMVFAAWERECDASVGLLFRVQGRPSQRSVSQPLPHCV
jgi:hypothetical protein